MKTRLIGVGVLWYLAGWSDRDMVACKEITLWVKMAEN
jgi:hypothetical protein